MSENEEKTKKLPDCRILTKYLPVWDRMKDWEMCNLLIQDIDYCVHTFKSLKLGKYELILKKQGIQWGFESMTRANPEDLDVTTLLALLVAAYRADHFCEGAFEEFVECGAVRKWLERLEKLTEYWWEE